MACANCGCSILFGGIKVGIRKYCSKICSEKDEVGRASDSISEDEIQQFAEELRFCPCPKCDKNEPVEIHKSYSVYSIIIYTSWKEHDNLVCKSCARKQQSIHLMSSALLGWWGLPFGIIVTPIIIIMNGVALLTNPENNSPTKALKKRAKLILAYYLVNENISNH